MRDAIRDIESLVHQYAVLCDQRYAPELVELFTADATWSSRSADGTTDFGSARGRDELAALFADIRAAPDIATTSHLVLAPQIVLNADGERATGTWRTVVLMGSPDTGTGPRMLVADYDHAYRRDAGRWRFTRLDAAIQFDLRLPAGATQEA